MIKIMLQVTEPIQKPPNISKCVFTEGGVKCGERTLPSAKHCRKHILKVHIYITFYEKKMYNYIS